MAKPAAPEVTEEELKKLALDMVAAGSLQRVYGLDTFMRAKEAFDAALITFTEKIGHKTAVEALRQPKTSEKVVIGVKAPITTILSFDQ